MNNKEILISFFLPSLEGGGAEKMTVNLIKGFIDKEFKVDIILSNAKGPFLNMIPEGCRIVDLKSKRVTFSLYKLVTYLNKEKPFALISGLSHTNIISLIAKVFSRSNTKFIVTEHNNLTLATENSKNLRSKLLPFFIFLTYRNADKVVAVSRGVAEDLENRIRYLKGKVEVIYNPIIVTEILEKKEELIDHSWFNERSVPITLSAGRLTQQKDYSTLLKAFSIVRQNLDCKLVILGEGEERQNLNNLVRDRGIEDDVWMPGFVHNPYKYMSKASVFVLSSRFEGFANVIVEAMASGTPVVATDCESGPREILDNGKYGKLVPIGDVEAMADAILETIKNPPDITMLQSRANQFNLDCAVSRYLEVIKNANRHR
jgi:glycosyltransferase involved in cell wall biosynthesis